MSQSAGERIASEGTSATSATVESNTALLNTIRRYEDDRSPPKWMRTLIWDDNDDAPSPLQLYSIDHPPLPSVPTSVACNDSIISTITNHPHLFKVVTPLNIPELAQHLQHHPNRPLVDTFIRMLREGAWPWASVPDTYPTTWDNSRRPLRDPSHAAIIRESIDTEVRDGRYSSSFGPDLLPGMYSAPLGVVPKPHTNPPKWRVVVDYSDGQFANNSLVEREDRRVPVDTVFHLGRRLRQLRKELGDNVPILVWKSDVSKAYRIVPMHPCWQIRQVVSWECERWVDWANIWGFCAAGHLLAIVMALMVWIAWEKYRIIVLCFVDDCFGAEWRDRMLYYGPYQRWLPKTQCLLLRLWDTLGIPHEDKKQLHGETLTITGFFVDTNNMTISMSDEQRAALLAEVTEFIRPMKRTLREFQSLTGWISWGLNVAPILRPCLACMYEKMRGKRFANCPIYINRRVRRDLKWFSSEFAKMTGVVMIESIAWTLDESDLQLFGDACLTGCGFYSPRYMRGFFVDVPELGSDIFLFEAFVILCQIEWAATLQPKPKRLVIYSDNENSVAIFNSLKAYGLYNGILLLASTILIRSSIDLRVVWLRGSTNVVADAISRSKFADAITACPGLTIGHFTPPTSWLDRISKSAPPRSRAAPAQ